MAVLSLAIDARKAKQGAQQFEQSAQKVARSARGAASSVGGFTTALKGLIAGVAATAAFRKVVTTVADFELSIATLGTVSRATEDQLVQLTDTARQLGATTSFTAKEAADGLLFLARAGFEVNQAIAAIPATLDLAKVGGIELGRAADFASNILKQFGLEAEDTVRVVDDLVVVSNRANTDVTQLAEALSFAGPAANALGISLEDTASAIGVLGDAGIQGSRAGAGLRTILLRLAAPTTAAKRAIRDLGLSVRDLNPELVSISEIFRRLRAAQAGATEFSEIFGLRQASAAAILAESTQRVDELTKAQRSNTGEARKNAEVIGDTVVGSFASFKSAVDELILTLGDSGLTRELKNVLDGATIFARAIKGVVEDVKEFNELRRQFGGPLEFKVDPIAEELERVEASITRLEEQFAEDIFSGPGLETAEKIYARLVKRAEELRGGQSRLIDATKELEEEVSELAPSLEAAAIALRRKERESVRASGSLAFLGVGINTVAENLRAEKEVLDSIVGPLREQALRRRILNKLFDEGKISAKQYREEIQKLSDDEESAGAATIVLQRALVGIAAETAVANKEFQDQAERSKEAAAEFGAAIGDSTAAAVGDTLLGFTVIEEAAKQLFQELQRIFLQKFVLDQISSAVGGFAAGTPGAGTTADYRGNIHQGGSVVPFQQGGIFTSPVRFPLSGGRTGLAGEAGPEAILPLERDSSGKLGVKAASGGGTVVNQTFNITTPNADSFRRSKRQVMRDFRGIG